MQWVLNLLFKLIDLCMSLFDSIESPAFVTDLVTDLIGAITKFCVIVNYYFPLDTLVSVACVVFVITIILMIVSAVLQVV